MGPVGRLSWSPDGSLLAATCGGMQCAANTIRVLRPDGTLAFDLTGHSQPVTSLCWTPDSQVLASGSLDGTIRLWSRAGLQINRWSSNAGGVFAVAWSRDGHVVASGSIVTFTNASVQLWTRDGQAIRKLSTSFTGGKFYNLAWSPDGEYLLGGATDYKLWRANGDQVYWLQGCASCTPQWGMAWSPDSRLWAVGDESGNVQIRSLSGDLVDVIRDDADVNSLAWSPDGRFLASPHTLWRTGAATTVPLPSQPRNVNSLAWSPDSRFLASGGSDAAINLFDQAGHALAHLTGHTGPIEVVAWSPNGTILASAGGDGMVWLWTVE